MCAYKNFHPRTSKDNRFIHVPFIPFHTTRPTDRPIDRMIDRRRPDVSPSLNPERYLTHTTRAGVGGSDFYLALLYFTSHTLGESATTSGGSSSSGSSSTFDLGSGETMMIGGVLSSGGGCRSIIIYWYSCMCVRKRGGREKHVPCR